MQKLMSRESLAQATEEKLFPTDLPESQWVQFYAEGFSRPVSGSIWRTGQPPCCGVPLGGISTGCLDVQTSGVFGFSTLFNPFPRKPQLLQPFLGLAVGGKTYVLTTREFLDGGEFQSCTDPVLDPAYWKVNLPKIEGVEATEEIHYWGHFPMADVEYEMDVPVSVGLRAWSPFIPGDIDASSIPGAVFEIHLRNPTSVPQQGTIAFSFVGPDPIEAHSHQFIREEVKEEGFEGIAVTSAANQVGYVLAAIGKENVRTGRGLNGADPAWAKIAKGLPEATTFHRVYPGTFIDASGSIAVDFRLEPKQSRIVRILLAWYAPRWKGEGAFALQPTPNYTAAMIAPAGEHAYRQMYTRRYSSALDVAQRLAADYDVLYKRVLAWQEAIYTDEKLPVWLRDTLVNNLALIPECSLWAAPEEPLGDWCAPDGLFGLSESPRACPQMECIPCSWYGNLPIVYFFPDLARTTLRAYAHHMREDGAVLFTLGPGAHMNGVVWAFGPDAIAKGTGYLFSGTYDWQQTLNGFCFVDMVDRLWQRTGDDTVLSEFYSAVKKSTTYTINLRPGPDGVISMPTGNVGAEWWEHCEWYGMCAHVGGLHLAMLVIAERMAEKVGDREFAKQCREWLTQGRNSMEGKMWNERFESYLLYNDPEIGKRSETIMANQFDGQWTSRFHGLPGVFDSNRVKAALETIKRSCVVEWGAVSFAETPGEPIRVGYGILVPEMIILAMTYLYEGDRETGLRIAHDCMRNLVFKQAHGWDLRNGILSDTGDAGGADYGQNMILWALPAALEGQDLRALCSTGGLVGRINAAGKKAG